MRTAQRLLSACFSPTFLLSLFVCVPTSRIIAQPAPPGTATVHVLFGVETPESGIFPSDAFTLADDAQKTGLLVNLPLPDCSVRVSDCSDVALINVLDGFNLQPRVTVPFDGDIDPDSINSTNAFFVELGDADVDAAQEGIGDAAPNVIGVNQLVWDPDTRVLAAESDEQLRQHTRYAFIVTAGVLDTSGSPVQAADALGQFRRDLNFGQADDPVLKAYRKELLGAFARLRRLGIAEDQVAGVSVFTTQSATAVLEHIRDQIKAATPAPVDFLLGAGGTRTTFSSSAIKSIDWQEQTKLNPPAFQAFKPQFVGEIQPFLLPDQYVPGAVGRVAYGSFSSPRYIADEPIMPAVGTRAGVPPVQAVDTVYVNVYLPAGTPPSAGWPVVIFGLGGGVNKDELPWFYAAAFASHGMATACINVVGQGFGPLSFLKVTTADGSVIQFPAGGRSKDLNGNNVIEGGGTEGVATITPAMLAVAARDTVRQTAVDYMQLVREIEVGVDVDGDGAVDLDASQISYFGISFGGGAFGQLFLAVEPDVQVGVLASPGGLNSRFDLLRLRPAARSQAGAALASRVPSLLNSPGLSSWAGIAVAPPFFNENIPLRNQPVVATHVDGAMEIQKYFDNLSWIAASGDGVSYAPHIRKEPLAGMLPKAILVNFAQGDQTAPNPREIQSVRAGDYADVTTFYLNNVAFAEDPTIRKDPHTYLLRWMVPGLSEAIGRGGQEQVATFLATRGQIIPHPEPARFFQVPISLPLPEGFSYIP